MQSDSGVPVVTIPGAGDLGTAIVNTIISFWHWLPHLWADTISVASWFFHFLVVISFPLSLFFIIGIIYTVEKMKIIKKKYELKHDVKVEPAFEQVKGQKGNDLSLRWKKAQAMLNSDNPNDWKQAIMEADTMLLEVLTSLGYQGDGIGEKLKRVQPGEMKSLDDAWEGHKVRNAIAHESGYQLDHHAAVQAMHRFRKVLEEFYFV